MQQAADVAVECGRQIAVVGRSMRKNLNIARNLGYLTIPDDAIVAPKAAMELPPDRVLILCTGSQGEPMSALTRIAYDDHANVAIERGDTVIISAKPVPGNELRVHDAINRLARAGAEVLHQEIAAVHVSGHACSEELRTMLSLVRPRAVMPIHGEYRMLAAHAQLAREAGVPAAGILIADNGSVVELEGGVARIVDRIDAGVTFVDGLGVGDVHDVALRDRRRLSEDGVLIVVTTVALSDGGEIAPPELIARGFGDDEELLSELRDEAERVVTQLSADGVTEIKLHAGAPPRRDRPVGLRQNAPATDDPPRGDRSLMATWPDILREYAADDVTARRLTSQLRACEAAALAFCRLLERWSRGDAAPATAGARQAALRHAADRVETALAGLEDPLSRYLLELEPERVEGRSWYGGPGPRRARRVATRARPGRCARLPEPGRVRVSGARRPRAGARGPDRRGASRSGARPVVALGRPVRSAGHAARLDRRRRPRAGGVTGRPARVRPRITVVGSVNLDLVARC